jgi:diaminohydroxyphosphoribosylaminopyrimidine deaminase/5-amino-6-(5-phosphoribosylamino)uracil reductase
VEDAAARELNAPFFFAASGARRPWVTLKLAVSLDGAIAAAPDSAVSRRWLTGESARKYVHRLRAQSDAVAVGIGTALADDPLLTVRSGRRPRVAPLRVVFDRSARLPIRSRLVKSARRVPLLVMTADADAAAAGALEAKGVLVEAAPDIVGSLEVLHRRGVRSLLVEGGAILAGALMAAKVVDRLVIFQAPVVLGSGALPAFSAGGQMARFTVIERREFGEDLMTVFAVKANDEL